MIFSVHCPHIKSVFTDVYCCFLDCFIALADEDNYVCIMYNSLRYVLLSVGFFVGILREFDFSPLDGFKELIAFSSRTTDLDWLVSLLGEVLA